MSGLKADVKSYIWFIKRKRDLPVTQADVFQNLKSDKEFFFFFFFYLKSHQELEQLLWQGAGGTVCTFLECLFELLHPYKLDFHSALKQKMCPHSLEVTHGTSGEIDKISLLFILNKAARPKCLFDGSQSFDLPTSRLDLNVSPGGQTLNGTSYKQWQTQALSNMILSIFFPLSYSLIYSVTEIIAESISLPL